MISWRISICCGERSFPCWLGAKSSSRSLTNVFFCSSVNPERASSSSAIWCFWYGSTPVESLRQCHRSVSTVWKEDKTIHVTAIAQQAFFISIRNTSKPVVILNDSIPTTKPEPQLHGFGLVNIHLILENIMENIPCSMRMDGFNSLLTYLSLRFRDKKSISLYYCRNFKPKRVFFYSRKSSGWGLQ